MTGGVGLRPVAFDDARAVAEVHVRSRNHAYADIVDPRTLAERTIDVQERRWAEHLAADLTECWLAELGGRVCGFVSLAGSDDADATPATGMIHALYVDPPAQGAGVGTQLLDHATDRLRARGHDTATLWVYAENGLARAFYERHGWAVDPAGPGNERPEWTEPSVRYRRALG